MKKSWFVPYQEERNVHHSCGFTLLEIIIAIGLSAFLLAVVYSTYFAITRSIEAATGDQEVLQTGRMMREFIRKDLNGIIISKNYYLKGSLKELGGGETATALQFVIVSSSREQGYRVNKVAYSLVVKENGERVLVRFSSPDTKGDLVKDGTVFAVSRNIKSFNVEFYDGSDWLASWDSEKDKKLPQFLRFTYDVEDEKGNRKNFIVEEGLLGGASES